MELLLQNGANIKDCLRSDLHLHSRGFPSEIYNALELAIIHEAPIELVDLIIQLGADVNFKQGGIQSFEWYHGEGALEGIELEIGALKSESLFSFEVRIPLYLAILHKNFEVAQMLVNAGAKLDELIQNGTHRRYATANPWKSKEEILKLFEQSWSEEEKEMFLSLYDNQ